MTSLCHDRNSEFLNSSFFVLCISPNIFFNIEQAHLIHKSRKSIVLWWECSEFLTALLAITLCFPLIVKWPYLAPSTISSTQSATCYQTVSGITSSFNIFAHSLLECLHNCLHTFFHVSNSLHCSPHLSRLNCHITLCKFKMYTVVIWHTWALQNDYHDKVSYCTDHYTRLPFLPLP